MSHIFISAVFMFKLFPMVTIPKEANAISDWRCTDSDDGKEWDLQRRNGVVLELHNDLAHGDVCREVQSLEFYCPVGCDHVLTPPFCSLSNFEKPCRVSRSRDRPSVEKSPGSSKAAGTSKKTADDLVFEIADLSELKTNAEMAHFDDLVKSIQLRIESARKELDIVQREQMTSQIGEPSHQVVSALRQSTSVSASRNIQMNSLVMLSNRTSNPSLNEIPFFFHVPKVTAPASISTASVIQ